jgi:8-oxo-dGTP pyrophosphatase MutT (NUDIX family)
MLTPDVTTGINIGEVGAERAGTFSSAFVLPITRDGRALLTEEKRGNLTKYGMLGGSACPHETDFECMSRQAKEETGGALSAITLARIAQGRGVLDGRKVHYENAKSVAVKHDLVVPSDQDVDARFDPGKAASMRTRRATICKKSKQKAQKAAATQQLRLVFVPLEALRDWKWRSEHMHHCPSVLCARLMRL